MKTISLNYGSLLARVGLPLLLGVVFFLPKLAKADITIGQYISTYQFGVENDTKQALGIGLTGTLKEIDLKAIKYTGAQPDTKMAVEIQECTSNSYSSCTNFLDGSSNKTSHFVSNETITSASTAIDIHIDFSSTTFTFNSSKWYTMDVGYCFAANYSSCASGVFGNNQTYGLTGTGDSPNGFYCKSSVHSTCSTSDSLFFSIRTAADCVAGLCASLTWPSDTFFNGVSTVDFKNWSVCIYLPPGHATTQVHVNFGYGSGSFTDHQDINSSSIINTPSGTFTQCVDIPKQNDLSVGSYQVLAVMLDQNTNALASNTLTFNIVSGIQTDFPVPGSSSSGTGDISGTTFGKYFGGFIDVFKNKIPFVYFFQIQEVIIDLDTLTDDTTPTLTLDLTSSSIPITVDILNDSTISQYVGSDNITLFRNLMVYSIWIGFGTMVFFTVLDIIKT